MCIYALSFTGHNWFRNIHTYNLIKNLLADLFVPKNYIAEYDLRGSHTSSMPHPKTEKLKKSFSFSTYVFVL